LEYRAILARLRALHEERQRAAKAKTATRERSLARGTRDFGCGLPAAGTASRPQNASTFDISASAEDQRKKQPKRKDDIPKRTAKEEGELAEQGFAWMAGKNGIKTAKPEGETLPFDRISVAKVKGGFKLRTVQVKCTSAQENYIYKLKIDRSGGRPYEPGDFDFLAVLVVPEDAWYVIPFKELRGRSYIYFHPRADVEEQLGDCDLWRNRWDLLR
jgi:hypothetical protein